MSGSIAVQLAKYRGANMGDPIGDAPEKAVTVRPSSTANFYVDSLDKPTNQSSGNFDIVKGQSLFNGIFNRIAVTEVVMDWGLPNVAEWWGNNFLVVSVDQSVPLGATFTVTIPDGFYSVLDVLNEIVSQLNSTPGQGATFSVGNSGQQVGLVCSADFAIYYPPNASDATIPVLSAPNYDPTYYLGRALFSSDQLYTGALPAPTASPLFSTTFVSISPLVLGTRYVDIVSPQLTYNQDLKDSTTAPIARDALYRWYFAWDGNSGVESLTAGGTTLYPYYVLQGYKAFNQRRALPYPKQILWNPAQPIGQVSFQSYDDRGRLIDTTKFTPSGNYQFQMSMLLSEN